MKKLMEIFEEVGKIEKEMQKKSETSFVFTNDETSCLFSVYYLNPNVRVDGNTKILNSVKKIEKICNVKQMLIGKTVTLYCEEN